jgi:Radical SAM superfamily
MKPWLANLLQRGPLPEPPAAGVYHLQGSGSGDAPYRLHLRIEPDGTGVLVANASTILHLNSTAAEHAAHFVQGLSEEAAAARMAARYRVSTARAREDTRRLREQITEMATRRDQDPVVVLGMDRAEPFAHALTAPYRLDLALTYRTDAHGGLDPLARKRVDRELSTDEWKQTLHAAWDFGIPHVTFTGGEPTLRADLVDLIAEAERIGQVAGLLSDGRRLAEAGYLQALSQAGLDHILVALVQGDETSLTGLKQAIASPVFTAAHLTVTAAGASSLRSTLKDLKSMGLGAVSISSPETSGPAAEALSKSHEWAADLGLELIWDLPVPFSAQHPIHLEAPDAALGSGVAWLYVEPDGDVLPSQGIDSVLGNVLRDPWSEIWKRAGSQ